MNENVNKPQPVVGYTAADEMAYLRHVLEEDGKTIDGVVILESWLKHCKTRKWDFNFHFRGPELISLAKQHLASIKARRAAK
jgi:hypothetical protein